MTAGEPILKIAREDKMSKKLISNELFADYGWGSWLPRVTMRLFLNDAEVAAEFDIEIMSSPSKPKPNRRRRRVTILAMRYFVMMTIGKKVTYDRVSVIGDGIDFSHANPAGPITVNPKETITVDQLIEIW